MKKDIFKGIPIVPCNCKGCHEEREALQKQLDSEFYKKVDAFRDEIKLGQLKKAAKKYDEPFNADSWTGEELAAHAMQENYDQSVYITGLRDRVLKQEKEIEELNKKLEVNENFIRNLKDYLLGDKNALNSVIAAFERVYKK